MKTTLKKIGIIALFVFVLFSGFVSITNSTTKNTTNYTIFHNWQHSIFK